MESDLIKWAGFILSFLAVFLFSLFHVSLSSLTKIAVSRILEDREKQFRIKILEIYDELKVSTEILRAFFLIAFIVYLYMIFPRLQLWPLWLFLIIMGGYFIGVTEAGIPSVFYINQTFRAIQYVDFFSGFIKVIFFSILVGWICCYQGFYTKGGSLGVGRFTTKAVAYSYIIIIISNTLLTKIILTFWG